MNKILIKSLSVIMSAVLLFSFSSFGAHADNEVITARTGNYENISQHAQNELSLHKIKNKNVYSYTKATLTYNGKTLYTDARIINGTVYVQTRAFIDMTTDMTVTYNSASRTLKISGSGLNMTVSDGAYAVYANDRILFANSPSVIMSTGRMYTPLSLIAKALGLEISANISNRTAKISGKVKPLESGKTFYRNDEVLWLARIISAESKGESLLGQLAVGAVILNRVKSAYYPNTIYGVIFDQRYGVQFSPIVNGSVYNSPTSSAILAAKACLDGFRVSDSILFFLNPRTSTSLWIPSARTYVFSIGKHDFYA